MAHALRLAERGLYTAQPNPRVGCVIAHGDAVVGTGFHRRAGEPHAEVFALREAAGRARGATAYVTLEPCAHQGRTPPCSDALIAAGVARVVIAAEDPFPQVDGRGIGKLRAEATIVGCRVKGRSGIPAPFGCAQRQLAGFFLQRHARDQRIDERRHG